MRQSMRSMTIEGEMEVKIPPIAAGKTVNLYVVPKFKLYSAKVVRFEGPDVNGQATKRIEEPMPLMDFDVWEQQPPEIVDTSKMTLPKKAPPSAKLRLPASGQSAQALDRNITFEPEVITVSEQRRAQLLQKAGWKQVDISIVIRNFLGRPLDGHKLFAEFQTPRMATVTVTGDVHGGSVSFSKVWLKPEGTVRLMAVSTDRPMVVPTQTIHYRLPEKGLVKFEAVQDADPVPVTAQTSQEAAIKVGAKGSAGVDFEVVQFGGEVSAESERKKGTSRSYTWTVKLPLSTLTVRQL